MEPLHEFEADVDTTPRTIQAPETAVQPVEKLEVAQQSNAPSPAAYADFIGGKAEYDEQYEHHASSIDDASRECTPEEEVDRAPEELNTYQELEIPQKPGTPREDLDSRREEPATSQKEPNVPLEESELFRDKQNSQEKLSTSQEVPEILHDDSEILREKPGSLQEELDALQKELETFQDEQQRSRGNLDNLGDGPDAAPEEPDTPREKQEEPSSIWELSDTPREGLAESPPLLEDADIPQDEQVSPVGWGDHTPVADWMKGFEPKVKVPRRKKVLTTIESDALQPVAKNEEGTKTDDHPFGSVHL